ncbi:hypothetical protein BTR14_07505 [Rhizobium rhizosphaerae]|uniref:Glycosyltransferase n=1 Tax=Xaviernesmea rhizosphaerae TaxID=1672749 RepID=A0ABX3PFH1_9HYPH|nr:glycosyltransferase [Xaviernesmea rhizosphaerae]OQP87251.1 hypothetical protein BTR14_07505 [Xaviernesmea rhizosphaerae]
MRDEKRLQSLKQDGRWLEAAQLVLDDMAGHEATGGAWVQLGHLIKEGGALALAERAYGQAVRLDGTDWDPLLHLGHLLKSQGKLAEALAVFERMRALPHAPDVSAECAELTVFLHPLNQQAASRSFSAPAEPRPHPAEIALAQGLDRLAARERPATMPARRVGRWAGMWAGWWRLLARFRPIRPRLVPNAHLIIENGRFVATTDQPQFRIETRDALQPGWYRFDIDLTLADLASPPRLWIEYAAPWQGFSAHDFAWDQAGFRLFVHVTQPALRLRLDPVFQPGPFVVRHFDIVRLARRAGCGAADGLSAGRAAGRPSPALAQSRYQKWLSRQAGEAQPGPEQAVPAQADGATGPVGTVILLAPAGTSDAALRDSLASLRALEPAPEQGILVARAMPGLEGALLDAPAPIARVDDLSAALVLAKELRAKDLGAKEHGARGRYALILEAGGQLASNALACFAAAFAASPEARIAYCDEDFISNGRRHSPLLKPDWDPELQAAASYVGPCLAVDVDEAARALGAGLSTENRPTDNGPALNGAPVGDCASDWFAVTNRLLYGLPMASIPHVDSILHHRPWAGDVPPDLAQIAGWSEARRGILHEILRAADADVEALVPARFGLSKVIYVRTRERADVTLVIPTRDQAGLLAACVDSLMATAGDARMQILIMDNDSREAATEALFARLRALPAVTILPDRASFNFSRLCNLGVEAAQSRVVGLVNNDVVAIQEGWLDEMVRQAIRPAIGAVGAKLLYRSGHVQHAGIVCGIGEVSGHPHKYAEGDQPGYLGRLAARQTVSAVTGACLFVEKRKYQEVGGMDEAAFPVAFNDVDLCLKLDARGYRNLLTPHATLYHLESLSRGRDVTPEKRQRYREEGTIMKERWEARIRRDPYYNRHLTRRREDYTLAD